jgi:hypothetical protein
MLVPVSVIFPDWDISETKVNMFRELLRRGSSPDPILLRISASGRLIVVDGSQRYVAALEEGYGEIEAGILDANGAYCA